MAQNGSKFGSKFSLKEWNQQSIPEKRMAIFVIYDLPCDEKHMKKIDPALNGSEFDESGEPSHMLTTKVNDAMKADYEDQLASYVPSYMLNFVEEYEDIVLPNINACLSQKNLEAPPDEDLLNKPVDELISLVTNSLNTATNAEYYISKAEDCLKKAENLKMNSMKFDQDMEISKDNQAINNSGSCVAANIFTSVSDQVASELDLMGHSSKKDLISIRIEGAHLDSYKLAEDVEDITHNSTVFPKDHNIFMQDYPTGVEPIDDEGVDALISSLREDHNNALIWLSILVHDDLWRNIEQASLLKLILVANILTSVEYFKSLKKGVLLDIFEKYTGYYECPSNLFNKINIKIDTSSFSKLTATNYHATFKFWKDNIQNGVISWANSYDKG